MHLWDRAVRIQKKKKKATKNTHKKEKQHVSEGGHVTAALTEGQVYSGEDGWCVCSCRGEPTPLARSVTAQIALRIRLSS